MKLGKKPYIPSKKDLLYHKYRGTLPPIPPSFGHQSLVTTWGMLGNDNVGDCVIAGADHETMLWTAEGSVEESFTTENALSDYSAITGYDPHDPNSDQGTEVRTALQYRRKTGMIDVNGNRHKIAAYLLLDQSNLLDEVLEAAYLFSAVGIGINFPNSAMDQFDNGKPWSVVQGSQIAGGHYVPVVGYDGTYLYCITWGQVQKMTVDFLITYCEEAWAILSQEFINDKGVSPEGFNFAELQADLAAITGSTPTPPPTPKLISLTVTPDAVNLRVGTTQSETVIAKYSDGSMSNVTSQCTWSSSNSKITKVNGGVITGVSAGNSTVTASYSGISVNVNVIVSKPTPAKQYYVTVKNLTKAQAFLLMATLKAEGFLVIEGQQS